MATTPPGKTGSSRRDRLNVPNVPQSNGCRKIGCQQPDQQEGYKDPAVGTILALAWAQISAAKSAKPDSIEL
jgi:hypothetical protein